MGGGSGSAALAHIRQAAFVLASEREGEREREVAGGRASESGPDGCSAQLP